MMGACLGMSRTSLMEILYLSGVFAIISVLFERYFLQIKYKIKLIKNEWSIVFNNACLKENILPNYTRMDYTFNNSIYFVKMVNLIY